MILIADGGSTKVDWIALDNDKKEIFRTRTQGLNPAIIHIDEMHRIIRSNPNLTQNKEAVEEIHFYGAGCSTDKLSQFLAHALGSIFTTAAIHVNEDMLAAVYAASNGKESIVCILGTGSNSTYFDGKNTHENTPSLGYILMDEASGNFFGKRLLIDYFYKKMPSDIATDFAATYNLDPDEVKRNLYKEKAPNTYLGHFSKFMFTHKDSTYIHQIITEGFDLYFERQIIPFQKPHVPIYFIGSIAYYFKTILQNVAKSKGLIIEKILQRPINNLVEYHQLINKI